MANNEKQEQVHDEQAQATNQEQADQQAQEKPDIDKKIGEALKAAEERWKKELSGLNKRNSELEKQLKEKEREKLSEEERLNAEKEEAQRELDSIRQEVLTERQKMIVARELYSAGLPEDFANRIAGGTDDEIKEDVQNLKSFLDHEVQSRLDAELKKRLGGGDPKGGETATKERKSLNEFNKLLPKQQAEFMKNGGVIE